MTVPRKDPRPATGPASDLSASGSGVEAFDRNNIGSRLRAAREAKGLTLNQLADQTRVRVSALEAIEAGDFERLPEPIYVQSYLRAFAQAVGLPVEPVLEAFRRAAPSIPAPSAVAAAVARRTIETRPSSSVSVGGIIAVLAVLTAIGGYLFISFRSQAISTPPTVQAPSTATISDPPGTTASNDPNTTAPGNGTSSDPSASDPSASDPGTGDPGTGESNAVVGNVNLSVTSTPAGASVLLDGIRVGVTPLVNAPVTAGSSRELRVELPGYKATVKTVDLSSNRSYAASLVPNPPAGTPTTPGATAGQITLTFQGPSWVRITDASGKRLYEGIPAAGTVKNFPGPVSVRAGRPDLIVASIGGQPRGALGTKASPATVRLP
jgi:cytoskeleton protein RodZ